MLPSQRTRLHSGRIADDVAAVVKLRLNRRRDGVGLRHIAEVGQAVHRDAVIQVLEHVVHAHFLPEGANATGIVHDVAQAAHEPRGGARGFEGPQPLAKLSLGTQRLVIYQDEVRRQPQRGVSQDLTPHLPEVLLGGLLFILGLLDRSRGQQRGQFDVVAALGQREAREGGLGGDVGDAVGIRREEVAGNSQGSIDVPQSSIILRVQEQRSDRGRPGREHARQPCLEPGQAQRAHVHEHGYMVPPELADRDELDAGDQFAVIRSRISLGVRVPSHDYPMASGGLVR